MARSGGTEKEQKPLDEIVCQGREKARDKGKTKAMVVFRTSRNEQWLCAFRCNRTNGQTKLIDVRPYADWIDSQTKETRSKKCLTKVKR